MTSLEEAQQSSSGRWPPLATQHVEDWHGEDPAAAEAISTPEVQMGGEQRFKDTCGRFQTCTALSSFFWGTAQGSKT